MESCPEQRISFTLNLNYMNELLKIQELLDAAKVEGEKFFDKGNKAAGVRLRKNLQDIKNLCSEIRKSSIEKKNEL